MGVFHHYEQAEAADKSFQMWAEALRLVTGESGVCSRLDEWEE
jgi:hypothetical protein